MTITTPTLEGYDDVLRLIASDSRISPDSPAWIREHLHAAGDQVRILRYILAAATTRPVRILDVGAQIGAFILCAARLGCQTAAVDYPIFAARYGKIAAEHGVDYRECDVGSQSLPFEQNCFHFVVYTDVIEHHSFSPKRVLAEIYRVLSPGGRVIVTTPNHASIYNRLLLLSGKSVNDNFDFYFDGSAALPTYWGHHREFTRREVRLALERTGFNVRECRIVEEDLSGLWYFTRSQPAPRAEVLRQRRAIGIRALGKVWKALHLPFGRVIWAVGEKPSA